jgi:hypothetical protein
VADCRPPNPDDGGSIPSSPAKSLGPWCSGSIARSQRANGGSIPLGPTNFKELHWPPAVYWRSSQVAAGENPLPKGATDISQGRELTPERGLKNRASAHAHSRYRQGVNAISDI